MMMISPQAVLDTFYWSVSTSDNFSLRIHFECYVRWRPGCLFVIKHFSLRLLDVFCLGCFHRRSLSVKWPRKMSKWKTGVARQVIDQLYCLFSELESANKSCLQCSNQLSFAIAWPFYVCMSHKITPVILYHVVDLRQWILIPYR